MIDEQQARKDITCYACRSNKVTAYIDFSNENTPRPKINFDCAECLEHGIPTPIMGLEVTMEALKFIFRVEDVVAGKDKS